MTGKTREKMLDVARHFMVNPVTENALNEYLALKGVPVEDRFTVEDLQDHIFQVQSDDRNTKLFKQVLAELSKLEYIPEYESEAERNRIADNNDDVRVNIIKLFEDAALPFHLIDKVANEFAAMIAKTVESCGQTMWGKAMDVLIVLGKERFGDNFNTSHARDFALELYENAKKKKDGVQDTPATEVPGASDNSQQ